MHRTGSRIELEKLEAEFAPYANGDYDADEPPETALSSQLCDAAARGSMPELRA